ncbi:MAG: type II secretion system F family protein [Candidatus Omnitrophica bacterium]|nr:type II secretion system F family protein [Candidatus Omnitrophota bacterium]
MPVFEYIAKDRNGAALKGILDVDDRARALDKLKTDNLIVISLKEAAQKAPGRRVFGGRVKIDDLVVFFRQLATMVDAGIPILGIMDILSEQAENKRFKEVLVKIKSDIEGGFSLSSALSKHPKTFSALHISMVRAGESSGMLDEILERLASYIEKSAALQKKIKSALVYPAVVTSMALAITVLLLVKVIPVFKEVFSGFGAALPLPTLILIGISDFFRKWFLAFSVMLGAAVFLVKRYVDTKKGRYAFDIFLLRLPVFGILFTKVAVSKFTRTLSTLVKSGVPILNSLEVVAKTCGNSVFETAIDKVRAGVREGESIAKPLQQSAVFPVMVVKMIGVGEQTGELEKMLSKVADFYDEQVDAAVSALTSMLEPLIIAFLGIVIGGIVICMFMPIFKISSIVNM